VSWAEFERAEPEFSARVRRLLDAQKVKILATWRAGQGLRRVERA
jgi:hypothetical protein